MHLWVRIPPKKKFPFSNDNNLKKNKKKKRKKL